MDRGTTEHGHVRRCSRRWGECQRSILLVCRATGFVGLRQQQFLRQLSPHHTPNLNHKPTTTPPDSVPVQEKLSGLVQVSGSVHPQSNLRPSLTPRPGMMSPPRLSSLSSLISVSAPSSLSSPTVQPVWPVRSACHQCDTTPQFAVGTAGGNINTCPDFNSAGLCRCGQRCRAAA